MSNHPILAATAAWTLYAILRGIYRIYFHPLSKFPGPPLAAATRWYEFYYEIIKGGGWFFQIKRLHKKYGPIVRINSFELHVCDPDFWPTLYNFSPYLDKRVYCEETLQLCPKFEDHRLRRSALAPFFSRQSVLKIELLIKENIERLCLRLAEHRQSQTPANMPLLYRCLSTDIISEYCFSQSYRFLDDPERSETFFEAYKFGLKHWFLFREVPFVSKFMHSFGRTLPVWMAPSQKGPFVLAMISWARSVRQMIRSIKAGQTNTATSHRTVFHELLQSKIPRSEKTEEKMYMDAGLFLGAGFETTGYVLTVATFHILANPHILLHLKAELSSIWPEDNSIPLWTALERGPYLTAVIQEALRMGTAPGRLSRVNNHSDMQYKEWVIPKGTPVGMSVPCMHFSTEIFPDPWCFDPERWLKGEESKTLENYLVPFSAGARACIAQQLAKAEIYLTLAKLFQTFDMELFETTRDDIDFKRDYFISGIDPKSEGLKVIIT